MIDVKTPFGSKKFKITMLGARGAGKTSVLAAMYDTFQRKAKGSLQLLPDTTTSIALSNCLKNLKSSLDTLRIGGYSATTLPRTYDFELVIINKDTSDLNMTFRDYPGEWLYDQPDNIIGFIQESDVVLWAIDAAALMEKGGQYDEEFNRTTLISDFLKRALHKLPQEQKKLILLVPIKCESYMQRTVDIKKLLLMVEQQHASFIEAVKQANLVEDRFALAITCIQTLSKVSFSHIDTEGGNNVFVHKRTSKEEPYQPKHVEQLFYYCIPFILRRYMEGLSWLDKLKHIFTGDPSKDFVVAIKKLADDRIESELDGFKVLHGRSLFNPPKS